MLHYLSASYIYPVSSAPLKNGVIAMESDGTIQALMTAEEAKHLSAAEVTHYEGCLIPGLINTHCHLELSRLFQRIPQHTGLQAFVQQVIKFRATPDAEVMQAMQLADKQMYENGIVAVGDISNVVISKSVKVDSKVYYHTFIEVLGFNPAQAESVMQAALQLKEAFAPLKASVVPHAPYSVSPALFAEIKKYSETTDNLITMHNQETFDENLFFEEKQGAFLKLYEFLGLDIAFFKASGKTSLQTVLPQLPDGKVLLVHNTLTNEADIAFAKAVNNNLFWCLCANANLYIENRLPDVSLLKEAGLKITLGTDSLASNHQLSILAEMKTLQESQRDAGGALSFEELLPWATINGAEFLGIAEQFGSLAPGKKPGINLVQQMNGGQLTSATTIKRLI
ncbi:cytosine/adenosine deaminase-related metal-dependent hydrolase [Pedobacter sp. CAN_A7]|uniref:amidohydrolase family protein n=1 Tax=Pedobacter sp. CAN_A7 TaxID=2787722 RepID=UPI0018CAF0E4